MDETPSQPSGHPAPTPAPPWRRPLRPRLWTAFAAPIAIVLLMTLAGILMVAATSLLGEPDEAVLLITTVLVTQAVILISTGVFAVLSPTPWRRRIGILRGDLRLWAVPVVLLGAPFIALLAAIASIALFSGLDEHMESLNASLGALADSHPVLAVLTFAVAPGICEELLFRGYVQRRLLERWNPAIAILVTSLMFGAYHIDLQHAVGTTILGLWFGFVAWRTGAVWPSMLCHIANNMLALAFSPGASPTDRIQTTPELDSSAVIALGVAFIPFLAALSILLLTGAKHQNTSRDREPV